MPITSSSIAITGLVLAGGRGTRMGGLDKGLQLLRGEPLALHVLRCLAPQVDTLLINANRHLDLYTTLGAAFDAAIITDERNDFAGPLTGILAGLRNAATRWVLCVPCDTPHLPSQLGSRLAAALCSTETNIAMAVSVDEHGKTTAQPTCALLSTTLVDDLAAYLSSGGRKMRAWYARHRTVEVPFRDENAFYNVNSLPELAALERD